MNTKLFTLIALFFVSIGISAQDFSDLFTTYTPVTPPTSVYVTPAMPNFYDNSVTIIDNSRVSYAPSIRCTDSQTCSGELWVIDTSDKGGNGTTIPGEVSFKSFSNNTATITITKLKIDGKWVSTNIAAYRLAELLGVSGISRTDVLDLMKVADFFALSDDLIFIF